MTKGGTPDSSDAGVDDVAIAADAARVEAERLASVQAATT